MTALETFIAKEKLDPDKVFKLLHDNSAISSNCQTIAGRYGIGEPDASNCVARLVAWLKRNPGKLDR